jgi:GTPase
MKIGVA